MNTTHKPSLWLFTLLIMFPQLVETIYSPALPGIANAFHISSDKAAQTLSVYFFSFAAGVTFWGWLSDITGRRKAMLLGLSCYAAGSALALGADDFVVLLMARIVSAFGAATCSVVVQTMLRDIYRPEELAPVFSKITTALALSPAIGLISGGWIVHSFGHQGVFSTLFFLATILVMLVTFRLPETSSFKVKSFSLRTLAFKMLKDRSLWINACLISLFNAMVYSYYSLAPFIFEKLGYESRLFGLTGIVMAAASMTGGLLNKKALHSGIRPERLIRLSCYAALCFAITTWLLQNSLLALIPVTGIVIAFGIVIPNILGNALRYYRENSGTAGALFGMAYYVLLALLLCLTGMIQQLGLILTAFSILACFCVLLKPQNKVIFKILN